jgi:hypothetical protein
VAAANPDLEYLEFSIVQGFQVILSITGLKELVMWTHGVDFGLYRHWRDVSLHHGHSLRRLTVAFHTKSLNMNIHGRDKGLHELEHLFPNLEHLDIDVGLTASIDKYQRPWGSHQKQIYHWPTELIQNRHYFSTLKTFKVSILLHSGTAHDDHLIRNSKPLGCRLIAELWDSFDLSDPNSQLELMTLAIWQHEAVWATKVLIVDYFPHNSPESRFRFKECRREGRGFNHGHTPAAGILGPR